jgi:predicted chitinase
MGILTLDRGDEAIVRASFEKLRFLAMQAVTDSSAYIDPTVIAGIVAAGYSLAHKQVVDAGFIMLTALPRIGDTGRTPRGRLLACQARGLELSLEDALGSSRERLPVLLARFLDAILGNHIVEEVRSLFSRDRLVITPYLLHDMMPKVTPAQIAKLLKPMNDALIEFDIVTPKRWMVFLAQCAEETGELKQMTELPSGYASSHDQYKGRGPIQLTGLRNYTAAGKDLGLDLVHHPEIVAADPVIGFRTSAWYWKTNGLNKRCDKVASLHDFDAISNLINTGSTTKTALNTPTRQRYYKQAQQAWARYRDRCRAILMSASVGGLRIDPLTAANFESF